MLTYRKNFYIFHCYDNSALSDFLFSIDPEYNYTEYLRLSMENEYDYPATIAGIRLYGSFLFYGEGFIEGIAMECTDLDTGHHTYLSYMEYFVSEDLKYIMSFSMGDMTGAPGLCIEYHNGKWIKKEVEAYSVAGIKRIVTKNGKVYIEYYSDYTFEEADLELFELTPFL